MSSPSSQHVTQLLIDSSDGDPEALDKLMPLVYGELRQMASRYMQQEHPGHTLQATALVNELYLRLIDQGEVGWQNRAHFFAIAAQLMRQIVVDYARTRQRLKRGGGQQRLSLDEVALLTPAESDDVLALDEALERLGAFDKRKRQVVEMRFFGGLSVEEVAAVLGVSENTVIRDWRLAKAWLRHELEGVRDDES